MSSFRSKKGVPAIVYFLFFVVLISCRKEQEISLNVDFTYAVADSNYTVPARILLYNKTSGALFYKWTFVNANIATYDQKEPGEIVINTPGRVTIRLEAWNDAERKEKLVEIEMDSVTIAAFTAKPRINPIAPAVYDFQFTGQGGTAFEWSFEQGMPATSTERNPAGIHFNNEGTYKVFLRTKNDRNKTDTITQWISVAPPLAASFDIEPSFEDDDYEAPLTATLANHSISATQHQWVAAGGVLSNASDSIPTVYFANPGTYTVSYTASNTKQTITVHKTIVVKPNTGLRTFSNVKFGINTAHSNMGSFFSTKLRRIYKADDVTSQNGQYIDLCFFGLSSSFSFNKFISPDSVSTYTFSAIPGAGTSVFVNKQEDCGCGMLTDAAFDNIVNGSAFNNVAIVNSKAASAAFGQDVMPRIVLFENAWGKKGAIKIKQFVNAGLYSYIVCDIKVQKD